MFDEKTILARLQAGEDAQTIANEMAAAINAANRTYQEEKRAEEEAKAKAVAAEVQKKEDLQEILDLFADWMEAHYGVSAKDELKADQVIELIDSLKEYIDAIKGLEAMIGKKPTAKVIKSNTKPKSADETINAFLNQMGW